MVAKARRAATRGAARRDDDDAATRAGAVGRSWEFAIQKKCLEGAPSDFEVVSRHGGASIVGCMNISRG